VPWASGLFFEKKYELAMLGLDYLKINDWNAEERKKKDETGAKL